MAEAPPRYLFAYLGRRVRDREALLLFPPGVTLEDAGYDWRSGWRSGTTHPTLPAGAVERLRGLGVEVVDDREAVPEALERARAEIRKADPGAFAEDYLDVNARLGGERCVTIREYAMDTEVGWKRLGPELWDRLSRMGGVRMYGGAAFREGQLPGVLRLRVVSIALVEVDAKVYVPPSLAPGCRLHGACRAFGRHVTQWHDELWVFQELPWQHLGLRVAIPRRLLDELAAARDGRNLRLIARAALPVMGRVIDALPERVWRGHCLHWCLASMVAASVAETCEECAALAKSLRECGSLREMERRVRDASWAVSRTLERLVDRW